MFGTENGRNDVLLMRGESGEEGLAIFFGVEVSALRMVAIEVHEIFGSSSI